MTGWITEDTARTLFQRAGYTLEELKNRALDHGNFEAISLQQSCSLSLSNDIAELTSRNAVAWIQGQSDEHVVFTAHWDHFGVNKETDQDPPPGELICSGARDNGIGVAALLALAEAFLKVPKEKVRTTAAQLILIAITAFAFSVDRSAYRGRVRLVGLGLLHQAP